ncbi:MAG: hypothetical protein ACKV2T_25280 [Kofleriaceae bacterium]
MSSVQSKAAEALAALHQQRVSLIALAVHADQRVVALQNVLAKEQADVAALREGILGFLQSLAMTDEMSNEQREAIEAATRLREGIGERDALYRQIDELDARIAAYDPVQLARDEAAKKANEELASIAKGRGEGAGSSRDVAEQLLELAVRIEAIDFELGPLTDAVRAGTAASNELFDVIRAIDEAKREPVRAPVLHERTARGMLGEAHAAALGFFAALEVLPAPDDHSPRIADVIGFDDRSSPVDDILPSLMAHKRVPDRLDDARTAVIGRIERIQALLEEVRVRHAEVSQRRLAFEHQRARVRAAAGL